MRPATQVLQALQQIREAFHQIARAPSAEERRRIAHQALHQALSAPWSAAFREEDVNRHGWLTQFRDALMRIEQDPERSDLQDVVDEGLWAATELEQDLRRTLRAL